MNKYTKPVEISKGDKVMIQDGVGRIRTGKVLYVDHNGDTGWFIDFEANDSYGQYGFWKQYIDGGRLLAVNNQEVERGV